MADIDQEAATAGLNDMLQGMGLGMDPAKMQKMNEDADTKADHSVSKHINEMDDELKDRFKALKVIQNECDEFDEEEQKEVRKQEINFESKYQEIYELRRKSINADPTLDKDMVAALIAEFDERAKQMQDEDYAKLEIPPCDVKPIQNTPSGVSDFWVRALLNHPIG